MKTIRVSHVITSLGTGGAELVLLRLLSRTPNSVDPVVISLTTAGTVASAIEHLGIRVIALGLRRGRPDPRGVFRLAEVLRKTQPSVVQTWLYHADLFASLALPFTPRARLAWGIRNSTLDSRHASLGTRLTVRACAGLSHFSPDRIICCSETARQVHEGLGYDATKFVMIPNGFDIDRFAPNEDFKLSVRAELGLERDALIVGHVARFHPQKDHRNLIQAAQYVCRSIPDAHFVLCGGDISWTNPRLAEWIRIAGVPRSRIHLLGNRADMPRISAAFDVGVSSSLFGEAFSNAVGEAMSCAVPCVATDVGDARQVMLETGAVVPPSAPEQLAQAIMRLLTLPSAERTRLGQAARQRIQCDFSLEVMARRFHAVHMELADDRN